MTTWRVFFGCIVGSLSLPEPWCWELVEASGRAEQDNKTGFIEGASLDSCFLARSKG